mmetsp:Transcript_33839/g.67705  ORF Transcript_33839/g.67705 Transcript_33839/m.67705 type:complete len:80 (+) Transcript_33839:1607-1846(+)
MHAISKSTPITSLFWLMSVTVFLFCDILKLLILILISKSCRLFFIFKNFSKIKKTGSFFFLILFDFLVFSNNLFRDAHF